MLTTSRNVPLRKIFFQKYYANLILCGHKRPTKVLSIGENEVTFIKLYTCTEQTEKVTMEEHVDTCKHE